jgi:hypothetical protein
MNNNFLSTIQTLLNLISIFPQKSICPNSLIFPNKVKIEIPSFLMIFHPTETLYSLKDSESNMTYYRPKIKMRRNILTILIISRNNQEFLKMEFLRIKEFKEK